MSFFRVIPAVVLTDAMLVSSDVAEDATSAWSAATTYAVGDKVHLVSTHKVYESLQAGNLNNNPASATAWWSEVDSTNKWKMWDQSTGSSTTATGSMEYVVEPGTVVDRLTLVQVAGKTARVQVDVGGSTVYDQTIDLVTRAGTVASWYSYFFEPFRTETTVSFTDLPPDASAEITLTIDAASGSAACSCAEVAMGFGATLGRTQYGASSRIIDYSRKVTSDTGKTTLQQGRYSRRVDATVQVDTTSQDGVANLLTSLRALPALWVGADADGHELLTVYGFVRDWSIAVAFPSYSLLNIQIEGLA